MASNEYIDGVRMIWESRGTVKSTRSRAVAQALADSMRLRGEVHQSIEVLRELDHRLDSIHAKPAWVIQTRVETLQEITTLSLMIGDRLGAIAALDRLDAVDPVSGTHAAARRAMRTHAESGAAR